MAFLLGNSRANVTNRIEITIFNVPSTFHRNKDIAAIILFYEVNKTPHKLTNRIIYQQNS